jgi:hypothetical protein
MAEAPVTGLVEFLKARLDEDEERARFVQREQGDRSRYETEPWRLSWHDEYDLLCVEPSRVLAEVDAKRKLIEQHIGYYGAGDDEWWPVQTLRIMALPYASHPEYDESWRP